MNRRGKKRIRRGLICLAAGLLLCTGTGYLIRQGAFSLFRESKQKIPVREIWLLNTDCPAGTELTKEMLRKYRVPDDFEGAGKAASEKLTGRILKMKLAEGTILTEDLLESEEGCEDDVRLYNYGFVRLTDKLAVGDYVDIRISFPDGTDFIVLSKKRIEDLSLYDREENIPNTLWLRVNEEEILRLSSAAVDAYLWKGSGIYAAAYIDEAQKPAIITYPANDAVKRLMEKDPNITTKAETVIYERLRETLNEVSRTRVENNEDGSYTEPVLTPEPDELPDTDITFFD